MLSECHMRNLKSITKLKYHLVNFIIPRVRETHLPSYHIQKETTMIFPSVCQTQQEIQMKIPRPRQRGHAQHVNIDMTMYRHAK